MSLFLPQYNYASALLAHPDLGKNEKIKASFQTHELYTPNIPRIKSDFSSNQNFKQLLSFVTNILPIIRNAKIVQNSFLILSGLITNGTMPGFQLTALLWAISKSFEVAPCLATDEELSNVEQGNCKLDDLQSVSFGSLSNLLINKNTILPKPQCIASIASVNQFHIEPWYKRNWRIICDNKGLFIGIGVVGCATALVGFKLYYRDGVFVSKSEKLQLDQMDQKRALLGEAQNNLDNCLTNGENCANALIDNPNLEALSFDQISDFIDSQPGEGISANVPLPIQNKYFWGSMRLILTQLFSSQIMN